MEGANRFEYSKTKDEDIVAMLIAKCHIGARNCTYSMRPYVWKRNKEGVHVFHLNKTWEKLMIAARVIAGIKDPRDILVVGSRECVRRPIMKFAEYTQARSITSKWTPGLLTNQLTCKYIEPRVLIASDPRLDITPIKEASYTNVPIVAFCDTDSPLESIDIAVPCNTKGKNSIALMYWMLAREIMYLRGKLSREKKWEIPMDLFIHKTLEELVTKQKEPEYKSEKSNAEESKSE